MTTARKLSAIATVALTVILVGCTTSAQTTSPKPTSSLMTTIPPLGGDRTTTTTLPPTAADCTAAQLTVGGFGTSAAAGHEVVTIRIEDTSLLPCWLKGYPLVTFLNSAGMRLPVTVSHAGIWPPGVARLVLPPGKPASAGFIIISSDVSAGLCPTATSVKVKLPKVPASFAVNVATVMGPGILLCGPDHLVDVSPIVAGALLAVSPEVTVPTACADVIRPSELSAVTFFNSKDGLGVWSSNTHCGNRLVSTKDAGESWKVIGGELPALRSWFSPMIFPTPRVGWVLGDGTLFTTRDGGQTWSRVRLGGWVAAISASGSSLWAFVSPCNAAVNLCNYLLRYRVEATTFNGTSWREVGLLPAATGAEAPLVARLTPERAVIAASGERGQAQVSFTSDGGAHWTSVHVCRSLEPNLDTVVATGPRDVLVTCLGQGSAGVSPQALFRSSDGGKTWQAVGVDAGFGTPPAKNPIPGAKADAIGAASDQRLWMATTDVFYGSLDSGKSWFQLPGIDFEGGGSSASFSFVSVRNGWMLVPIIGLWRTTDGKSWRAISAPLS